MVHHSTTQLFPGHVLLLGFVVASTISHHKNVGSVTFCLRPLCLAPCGSQYFSTDLVIFVYFTLVSSSFLPATTPPRKAFSPSLAVRPLPPPRPDITCIPRLWLVSPMSLSSSLVRSLTNLTPPLLPPGPDYYGTIYS